MNAVVKVVTTYTTPGDRVLLLAASTRRRDPYRGLSEASWAVGRLGRSVRTEIVGPYDQSESGHGPTKQDTRYAESVELADTQATGFFDVIIAAAGPRTLVEARPTTWSQLLTPRGVLAAITNTDHVGHRLYDPSGALVRAGREDGLRYREHIALLQIPINRDGFDRDQTSANSPSASGVTRVRAHADLHVFDRVAPASAEDAE